MAACLIKKNMCSMKHEAHMWQMNSQSLAVVHSTSLVR